MNKRYIPLLVAGLVLGLALTVFGPLALARESVSPETPGVSIGAPSEYVKRQEPLEPPTGTATSPAVRLEPIRLQVPDSVTVEIRAPFGKLITLQAGLTGRDHDVVAVRPSFQVLVGQVASAAYSAAPSVPTHRTANGATGPAAVCVVNRTTDSGSGTLRQCLLSARIGDTITFDSLVFPPTSPATISLSSALPWIITDSLTIDASNAGVILDGSRLSSGDGFAIFGADRVNIQGLQILRFPSYGVSVLTGTTNTTIGGNRSTGNSRLGEGNLISGNRWGAGVRIEGAGTMSNTIQGNFIGTDVSGNTSFGNILAGVVVLGRAANNVIGGDTQSERNLISSNLLTGIWIEGAGTSGNQVRGNYIGTNISGTASLGHGWDGVFIGHGAVSNTVSGNLISSSSGAGVRIQNAGTAGNRVTGNYIGTDTSGAGALPNDYGVRINDQARDNVIGGDIPGLRNLISGNVYVGVYISDSGTSGNQVSGNYIGTDSAGTHALGNALMGIVIQDGATDNVIGGGEAAAGNLISGNGSHGILVQDVGTPGNQVLGNYIGTDVSGVSSIGNQNGVVMLDAAGNTIGGESAGARNLISGNRDAGIWMQGAGTSGNQVIGNYIGTNISGTYAISNGGYGVLVGFGATRNRIGGDVSETGNLISGNGGAGVWIQNAGTMSNTVYGNYIGLDASGTFSVSNANSGVTIIEGPTNNMIGGQVPETRNIISGNGGDAGVVIVGSGTMGNLLLGNYIGTNLTGTIPVTNVEHGVAIYEGATGNVVGGANPQVRNLISGNGQAGILLYGRETRQNQVLGNWIGTNASGTVSIPNLWGIFIGDGATNNTIGGTISGTCNLISGNKESGVRIEDTGTMSNTVLGNYIGTDISGTAPLSNVYGVAISFGAVSNTVGGTAAAARNLISYNEKAGVVIWDAGETLGNQVLGNYISKNAGYGVFIGHGATHNTIGISNTIVTNTLTGVTVSGPNTLFNTITRNAIYDNGGLGIDNVDGGNAELPPPKIITATSAVASGWTSPTHLVEIFSDYDDEGRWFEGSVQTGTHDVFTLTLSGALSGTRLTATATDASGNTSEFSTPFPIVLSGWRMIFLPTIRKNSG